MDLLRPSIEEAQVISHKQSLDYIGKRGSAVGVAREKRIKYAREILQKSCCRTSASEKIAKRRKRIIWDI